MKEIGLYIHIPFCKSKCYYCDFNSYSNKDSIQEEYIDCLIDEIERRFSICDEYRVKTVFIGGGTPTYLSFHCLEKLLVFLKKYICKDIEFTCEANPGTLDKQKLVLLRENGVNRLSIGLQSCDDSILKYLGRIHKYDNFLENFYSARQVGFNNINVDIMFSIQGQTIDGFADTLKKVIGLNPEHISCYSLIIEEGTCFGSKYDIGELQEVDQEIDRSMYYLAVERLKKSGYVHYEISNFARPGYECKHNIIYWRTQHYLGVGAGAHSYIDNVRFSNEASPEKYIQKINENVLPTATCQELSEEDRISEFMFMGLRMMEGVCFYEFSKRIGRKLSDVYKDQLSKLVNKGLVRVEGEKVSLTDLGIDLSNQVFVELLI